MAVANSAGLIGPNTARATTDQEFTLGTAFLGDDNKIYTYVQASGAIAASQTDIAVDTSFQASDGAGTNVGPAVAIADNEFFWVSNATLAVDN